MSDGVLGSFSLRGKGAIVTGAARGLGSAMALALAEAGADIVAVDVEPLAAVSDAVADRGVRCATQELDLRALTPDAAADLMTAAGAPPEALEPLMRRTMENGFVPTGPFIRGDRGTIERHLAAIDERTPELGRLYRELAKATEAMLVR